MNRFQYEITKHEADEFKRVVYFCSEHGDCHIEDIPEEQAQRLVDLFNERGYEGWELVQLAFRSSGILAVWKRKVP